MQLPVQRSLIAASHHVLLMVIHSSIGLPIKPGPATIRSVIVSGSLMVQSLGGAGDSVQVIAILLTEDGESNTFIRAVCAASLGVDSDRLHKDLAGRSIAHVVRGVTGVTIGTVGILSAPWQTLSIKAVEAGGVGRVLYVTYVGYPGVTVGIVSACGNWFALVIVTLEPSLTVTVVNTSWFAEVSFKLTVVAGCWILFFITHPVPLRTDLVAHTAVGNSVADSALDITVIAGGTVTVGSTSVKVTDTIVTDLLGQIDAESKKEESSGFS